MTLRPTLPEQWDRIAGFYPPLAGFSPPLIQGLPCLRMGGLPIAMHTRAEAARYLIRAAASRAASGLEPLYATSANGEVLARVDTDPAVRALFEPADLIHADGQAMVIASRLRGGPSFPERVATTDLFHDVAALAEQTGTSFFLLGGTPAILPVAVEAVRRHYPGLAIVGARHGYIAAAEEAEVVETIVRARPGILWVGMGVPREQAFILRNRQRLAGVGVIKTAGGLFDFLSGRRSRAPLVMQKAGLEWLYRTMLEPRRLGARYALTSPRALVLMLRRPRETGSSREAAEAEAFRP